MDIKKAKYIHFIGIGGIGTSSIAQILRKKGKIISGSDINSSSLTKILKLSKIKVYIGHDEKNVTKKHQLIIYSPAIPASNPEIKKAKKLKIRTIPYPQALGQLTKNYFTIAIAGTHGKSTTTAMTALALLQGGLDPTVVVGTKLKEFDNKNFRISSSHSSASKKYFIVEACEYKESFLHLRPNILVITNIEADHLDYYKTLKNYKNAFKKLIEKIPKNGTIIINSNDKNSKSLTKYAKAKVISCTNTDKIKFPLLIPGKFNVQNATCASIVAKQLKIPDKKIQKALKAFKGTWRRMERKKTKFPNVIFIDDYAHHPTEIKMTLEAIHKKHPKKRILCIFQPHQYSRTRLLLKEFGESFINVDKVIIPNIYKVRDSQAEAKKISTDDLVKQINKNSPNKSKNGDGLEKTSKYLKENIKKFDIVVTMGAGDIDKIYKLIS